MTLKEQLDKYVDEKTPEGVAAILGNAVTTVRMWRNTGKYGFAIVEAMQAEQASSLPEAPTVEKATAFETGLPPYPPRTATEATQANAILGDIDQGLVSALNQIDQLKVRMAAIETRFAPHVPTPAPPTQVVSPKLPILETVNDALLEASTVRPGPVAPVPHIVSGPGAGQPPQANQPRHWSDPYDDDYRLRRLRR